jgi:hypothetical protein
MGAIPRSQKAYTFGARSMKPVAGEDSPPSMAAIALVANGPGDELAAVFPPAVASSDGAVGQGDGRQTSNGLAIARIAAIVEGGVGGWRGSGDKIDIGRPSPAFPVTPPGVRAGTGRFGGLSYRPRRTCITAYWTNRASTVGGPSFRTPPSGLGIATRFTGCGL